MRSILLAMVMLAGCTLEFDHDEPPPLTPAQEAWRDNAYPAMAESCTACHSGSDRYTAFLAGADALEVRETLLASGMVIVDDPANSRLFTKGAHSGPPMTASQAAALLGWLDIEKAAAPRAAD